MRTAIAIVVALIVGALGGYEYGVHRGIVSQHIAALSSPSAQPAITNAPGQMTGGRREVPPAVRAAARSMRQACASDIASLCSSASPENGGIPKCLRSHRDQLSTSCSTAWQNLRAARLAARTGQESNGESTPDSSNTPPANTPPVQ